MNGFSNCFSNVQLGTAVYSAATSSCIGDIIKTVINIAFIFAGSVSAFVIIFAGIKMVTSGGDAKQVEGARSTITYGVLGLAIVLLSVLIINLIGYITKVDCIQYINGVTTKCQ